jgi:hypothetical protein
MLGSWEARKLGGTEAGMPGSWKAGRLGGWKAGQLGGWKAGQQLNQNHKYLGALKFIDQNILTFKLPGFMPASFLALCLQASWPRAFKLPGLEPPGIILGTKIITV